MLTRSNSVKPRVPGGTAGGEMEKALTDMSVPHQQRVPAL